MIAVDDRRVRFKVEAFDEKEAIADGTHERFVIHVERFAKRLAEKRADSEPDHLVRRIFHPGRSRFHQAAQFGLELFHLLFHFPGDFAIAEVAFHAAAQRGRCIRLRRNPF